MSDSLSALLDRQGVAILDGGLATELEARGHDIGDELWSARLLIDDPESLRGVHRDYLLAGADCIVSASYQASFAGFRRRGLSEREATRLLRRSVELARQARDELWSAPEHRRGRRRPLVAAGIGPYGAFLADGSEYTGIYDLDAEGLARFHRHRLQVLATSGADLLACETIPSAVEARVLVGCWRGSTEPAPGSPSAAATAGASRMAAISPPARRRRRRRLRSWRSASTAPRRTISTVCSSACAGGWRSPSSSIPTRARSGTRRAASGRGDRRTSRATWQPWRRGGSGSAPG